MDTLGQRHEITELPQLHARRQARARFLISPCPRMTRK
jgi:hypothetical protein